MLFIFFYSFAQAHLLFHYFKFKKNTVLPPFIEEKNLPFVTVQLPIFNEQYVIERLLEACVKINYPLNKIEFQVLDDSTDETSAIILSVLKKIHFQNFKYIHRENRKGYKAGALREGLAVCRGELIAIFDADFVPDPDFLLKTVGHFLEPTTGMVQTRWTHLNKNYSFLTRIQAFALDAHFMVEQMGRNQMKAFINFNGTGGIWRKSCIIDAGNWHDDTLTEDLDLSYRAQQKGWKFVYRPDIESPAELPPVMSAIKSQQFRWTKGGAECAVKHLTDVLSKPFSWQIKLHAIAHLLNSVIFVAVLLVSLTSIPVWIGFHNGTIPETYFKMSALFLVGFAIIGLVYFVSNVDMGKISLQRVVRFTLELVLFLAISMGIAFHNSQAVLEGLFGKKSAFVRTPKYNLATDEKSWKKNVYNLNKLTVSILFEMLLTISFLLIVVISIYLGTYEMLFFHIMLTIGYGLISFKTLIDFQR